MPKKSKSRSRRIRSDELPRGPVYLRNSAFTDMPPTMYFGRDNMPLDVYKPKTLTFDPVALYSGLNKVVVKDVLKDNGFRLTYDRRKDFIINWVRPNSRVRQFEMKPYQRFNHIPRSGNLGVKPLLSGWIWKAERAHPNVFNFHSEGYFYPGEKQRIGRMIEKENEKLKAEGKTNKAQFIVKPSASSRGRGISFISSLEDLKSYGKRGKCLVQKYIDNPLLINGKKFDLRIYVLVTSVSPLRVYVYNDGIVRISSEIYKPISEDKTLAIHLTNTQVSLNSGHFVAPKTAEGDENCNECTLKYLMKFIKGEQANPNSVNNYKNIDVDKIWEDIKEISKKTIISEKGILLRDKNRRLNNRTSNLEGKCASVQVENSMVDKNIPTENNTGNNTRNKGGINDEQRIPKVNIASNYKPVDEYMKENGLKDHVVQGSSSLLPFCHPLVEYDSEVYDNCYELFGFDYLIDENGKVWLIEVNISPSAETPSILDLILKTKMYNESFNIVGFNRSCGLRYESALTGNKLTWKEVANEKLKKSVDEFYRALGTGWERAYPDNDPETLDYFDAADEHDKILMKWCLKPSFSSTLSTATKRAKAFIAKKEQDLTESATRRRAARRMSWSRVKGIAE